MKFDLPTNRELAYIGAYIPISYVMAGVKRSRSTKAKVIGVAIGATTMLLSASLGYYRD